MRMRTYITSSEILYNIWTQYVIYYYYYAFMYVPANFISRNVVGTTEQRRDDDGDNIYKSSQ